MEDELPLKVYSFWTYNQGAEAPELAPFKATREAISAVWKGRVADGTEQVVSASDLDSKGRYRRIATGWGELD